MPVMKGKVRFLGLDVHAETITAAVAEPDGEVRSLGTIANRAESRVMTITQTGKTRAIGRNPKTGEVYYGPELNIRRFSADEPAIDVLVGEEFFDFISEATGPAAMLPFEMRDQTRRARCFREPMERPEDSKLGLCVCVLLDRHWHWPTTQVKRSDVENIKPPHELEPKFIPSLSGRSPVRSFS
jgi:hypothetical protein